MKILIATTETLCEYGGLGRSNYEIKKRLSSWGHEISEINLNDMNGNNAAKHKMPTYRFLNNFQKINTKVLKHDLVLAHGHWAGLFLYRHKNKLKIPIITIIHSLEKDRPLRAKFLGCRYFLSRILEYMTVASSDHILLSSNFMVHRFCFFYPNYSGKISCIGNGVDSIFLNSNDGNRKITSNVITVIGRLEPDKGILEFLSAFESVLSKDSSYKCNIIGSCRDIYKEYEFNIIRKINNSKLLKNSIFIFPFISDIRKLIKSMKESLAVIVPSIYEPFGLIALEAMATGTVVIANNVGGLPEYIENGRNGVIYNNSSELVESLLKIKDDVEFRSHIQINAHQTAKNLTWDTVAQKINSICEQSL